MKYKVAVEIADFNMIPDDVLKLLFTWREQIFRLGNSVLFKFSSDCKGEQWKTFWNWITELEIGDDYKCIILEDGTEKIFENIGCADMFSLGVVISFDHYNMSEIETDPCDLKSIILPKSTEAFDMKVKNGIP